MIAGRTCAAVFALLALAACSRETKTGPTTYVTVHPSASSTSASPSHSAAPSPSATAGLTAMRKLPGRCEDLLPIGSVMDAIGGKVGAGTAFVEGTPDAAIGRLGYLNCRYGVSKRVPAPAIEIGVSLYKTAAKAAARLQPTIADFVQHGAHPSQTTVHGLPATLLQGGTGTGYGPTVVMSAGQRTIAVSLRAGAFPASAVTKDLTSLATLAADQTAAQ